MPTYLDFNSTKRFRDFIIAKTLNVPNGPQTFNDQNYVNQGTSDYSNVDPGDVTTNQDAILLIPKTHNIFKPIEYWVTEYLRVIPRRANLNLYPYFVPGNYNLISIMATDNYDTESQLFKFAAHNIKNNENGPVFARIQQNLYAATVGRVRLIDALNGSLSTALNIVTGREPLIEYNTKISVRKTLPGKAIDFLGTITGTEWPFTTIPGDYLSNPRNPISNVRSEAQTEAGRFFQDLTGNLGSLIGINRRSLNGRKPSDLLLDYTGSGPKQALYTSLSYSKYAPNYTASARSQNTSKIFNFIDNIGGGVNKLLGLDAPRGIAYIGDDRGEDVKYAMGDFNDNMVRSPWYVSFMFDPIQTNLFHSPKNLSEGGEIGGRLVWISLNSQNKLGVNNAEYSDESSDIEESLSTKFTFRDSSILSKTQELLDSMPNGGGSRSHVANAIDQTSRVFREGDTLMSRGSAIKYIDQYTGSESGVEYCRVWTKDRSYLNMSDTMKTTALIRNQNIPEAKGSVLSTPYNLNIYPNSNGNKSFKGSSNIKEGKAKKYMFSIENLAWKTSNIPGFTYGDLPLCERGNNGGRVMWFPPYDLKVTEQNSAKWEETLFLGRPEPVYTYQNTSRNGTVSFKVIVDHPSIMNLLVRDHFKDMSDEEADNYINAFFAGCEDVDFYDLIRKYTTLTKDDILRIQQYLNGGNDPKRMTTYKAVINPVKDSNPPDEQSTNETGSDIKVENISLYFQNDYPSGTEKISNTEYTSLYNIYKDFRSDYDRLSETGLDILFNGSAVTAEKENDFFLLYGKTNVQPSETDSLTGITNGTISVQFNQLESQYNIYKGALDSIKEKLGTKDIKDVEIKIESSASSPGSTENNLKLSFRRSHSVIIDILDNIKMDGTPTPTVSWPAAGSDLSPIPLKSLGYDWSEGNVVFVEITNSGESVGDCDKNFKTSTELRQTAPTTFYCRETVVGVTGTIKSPNEKAQGTTTPLASDNPNVPKVILSPVYNTPKSQQRPPLDELKRIIMKTLSECYYFQKFEEDSPVAFKSLREKLKFFHPAFHSMTPEGLNSRLTFLNQCIRPGNTIPIKGISDTNDLNARNTTFGPPPICVMRIGDFYHSKVAIRDVNITYDDGVWDLNPEGIGIQPMIANVTLQLSFIGGHGLEKPVEMLQNALTSNFYANTEMYDYRSTATEDRSRYTKEFLEDLIKEPNEAPLPENNPDSSNNVKTGEFIGVNTTVNDVSTLEYTNFVGKLYTGLEDYFTSHRDALKDISSKYGSKITSMFLSPIYRTVSNYTVQTGSGTSSMEMLGEYPKNQLGQKDLSYYAGNFRSIMNTQRQSVNLSELMKFNKDLGETLMIKSEQYLQIYITKKIKEWESEFIGNTAITSVENTRNSLITTLDKLNFISQYNTDGYINTDSTSTGVTFSDYVNFYNKYDKVVEHIQDQYHKFTDDLDTSYVFSTPSDIIDDDVFSELLSLLLYSDKESILDLYRNDQNSSFDNYISKLDKRLDKFLEEPEPINVTLKRFPTQRDTNPVIFTIQDEIDLGATETEDLTKIMSTEVVLGTTLNFYKI